MTQLVKQGKVAVHVDEDGKEKIDEADVPGLRVYLDKGLIRGTKPTLRPRRPEGEEDLAEPGAELRPVEPEPYRPPAQASYGAPPPPRTPQKKPSEITEDDFDLYDDNGKLDPYRCRAWQEFEKAKKLQTERLAAEGRYVEVEKIKPAVDRAMQVIRKGVMAIPTRLKAVCHDLTLEQQSILERLCREALDKAVVNYSGDEEDGGS